MGFVANPESFFCHDPRSRSPEASALTAGEGAETAGADSMDGTGATDTGSSFSCLSGAFFFEAADPAELGMMEQHVQCQ